MSLAVVLDTDIARLRAFWRASDVGICRIESGGGGGGLLNADSRCCSVDNGLRKQAGSAVAHIMKRTMEEY
jgi:hypothetical protein